MIIAAPRIMCPQYCTPSWAPEEANKNQCVSAHVVPMLGLKWDFTLRAEVPGALLRYSSAALISPKEEHGAGRQGCHDLIVRVSSAGIS